MLDSKYTKWLRWFIILNKRLLKKKGFLIILALIPVISVLIASAGDNSGGFIRVAVSSKSTDLFSEDLLSEIDKDTKIIKVTRYSTPKKAIEMVKTGKADTAWVLEENIEEKINSAAEGRRETLVNIYAAEDNSFIRSSREKLFGALFPRISHKLYENFITEELNHKNQLTNEEIKDAYTKFISSEGLVDFQITNTKNGINDINILTAPLRGLLAIVMLFCALASTMYFISDDKSRIFSSLTPQKRFFVFLGTNIAALLISGFFVSLALIFSGVYTNPITETVAMLLYILSASAFCTLLGTILRSNNLLGAASPLILVICLALCPVFLDVTLFTPVKYLLPTFYYLFSITNSSFILKTIIFILCLYPVSFISYIFTRKYSKN